jgi:hypothetical protein
MSYAHECSSKDSKMIKIIEAACDICLSGSCTSAAHHQKIYTTSPNGRKYGLQISSSVQVEIFSTYEHTSYNIIGYFEKILRFKCMKAIVRARIY